jgi:choline transport protein
MFQTTPLDSSLEEKKQSLQEKVHLEIAASEIVNASGHRDQLRRQYGILSICGMALTVDNAWVAIGTSMNVAICELHASSNQT